jgi:uncharacterized protein
MKIAICSDSHDNEINITKFLHYCNKEEIETMLHCGDWCAPSIFEIFRENFHGKIHGVFGNVHADAETMYKMAKKYNVDLVEDKLELEIAGLSFFITHYPDVAKEVAEKKDNYDIIFYGHNHKPWMEKVNKTFLVNPGTLAGLFQKATFAVYDTEKKTMDLKLLEQL